MDNSQSPSIDMSQYAQNMETAADFSSFLDYNQLNSPAAGSSKNLMVPPPSSSLTSPITPLSNDLADEQMLMRPSHDYGRFKQQTGLPVQADIHALSQFAGYNTGIYESQSWENLPAQSSLDPSFEAFLEMSANDDYIDPNAIMKQEEAQANIRYFPGMHSQAAMQKQAMLAKQKQQREAEQQRHPQAARPSASRRSVSSQPLDARTEETISRVMSQIRQSSNYAADSVSPPAGTVLPHIIKAKKDEDDMDEDERLLNSEEGKKLSSKERRQLRNKVSARAFRSRRKEYIGQLEGELAAKANEAAEFKRQNQLLLEENARFRSLASKLLSHNAFRPFLEELSRDPELAESFSEVANTPIQHTVPQIPKDIDPFANSPHFLPPQNNNTHVGMTMIPEVPIDLSSLNLGNNWNGGHHAMATYQQPSVFAVTELPQGPSEPIDFSALSGKGSDNILSELAGVEEEKPTYPEIEAMPSKADSAIEERAVQYVEEPECELDENDDTITLFANSRSSRSAPVEKKPFENLFGSIASEKALGHFDLVVRSGEEGQSLDDELARMTAKLDSSCRRIERLMSRF